ncbi:hypothetical protein GCM10010247_59960 [Streptomyces calvus]|nr:hypothetical protein GCM10010247_59960 [Streptomyces calvus]
MTDTDSRYEAVRSRDARFDGVFFFAVETTGIYCRPSCPAVTPKRHNVRFFATAAAAQGSGFRACRRCRPDAVPGSAEWNVRADVVGRAMRMIADGVVDREGVAGLAARLGYSTRQVQRQLTGELGAGPVALARAQRAHAARVLLQTTGLPVTQIAFAAGFASVRQFNDTMRAVYAATPSELRAAAPRSGRTARRTPPHRRHPPAARPPRPLPAGTRLRPAGTRGRPGRRGRERPARRPHLPAHPAPAVRHRHRRRRRTHRHRPHHDRRPPRRLARRPRPPHRPPRPDHRRAAAAAAVRPGRRPVRRRRTARRRPPARPAGRRPARAALAADPDELAVRALAGRDEAARLVQRYGKRLDAPCGSLTHLFPEPGVLAEAEPDSTLGALAAALADGTVRLGPGADRDEAREALAAVPGLDERTIAVIRTRALGDPDVAPPGPDVPDSWRPWRSYALNHLRAAGELEYR